MPTLSFIDLEKQEVHIPEELLKGKRHLTPAEISVLEDNLNNADDGTWKNVYVDDSKIGFDPTLIKDSTFSGYVILGRIWPATLKYHDLTLSTGISNSRLKNVVTGNDNAIVNVSYLENYRLGDRVMLFNIQEMSCTTHSKFGNGILKEGEKEETRISIAVGNENGGRAILPFEKMIPADAYIWSRFRADKDLMEKFKKMTEKDFSKKRDTYGIVDDDAIIKNTVLIKDCKIGANTYIKGAFKIKNVTILSSPDEVSQIGEGVELVNGIMGEGSRVFYQAVAIRFIIGKNCQLKYGARLLNSVLGDNSTVSCCELLNNLIYPFHEQHHNSSFLISTTLFGQSNIAAGATIGSNHNSRTPDGEIIAGRGFWPGLCTSFKHNSRFASFILASKGSYQHELDIPYPFSLIAEGETQCSPITIIPAWYFMYDTFAIIRNKYKFAKRDRRVVKIQNIETNPIAPDTVCEIENAIDRIVKLTSEKLKELDEERFSKANDEDSLKFQTIDFLNENSGMVFTLDDSLCQRKYGAKILKPGRAYKIYRKALMYFVATSLLDYCAKYSMQTLSKKIIKERIEKIPLYEEWRNLGGQLIPSELVSSLLDKIKSEEISGWDEVHDFYNECESHYSDFKARYAISVLEKLYSCKIEDITSLQIESFIKNIEKTAREAYDLSICSRKKDFTDYYRKMVYESDEEMKSVIGNIDDDDFLNKFKNDITPFIDNVTRVFKGLEN